MLTADTITDEQIRELRDDAWRVYAEACKALGIEPHGPHDGYVSHERREVARANCAAICAEILNARPTPSATKGQP